MYIKIVIDVIRDFMADEVNFFDLVALLKIKPGVTVERYGGLINSSFFDGATVLGTLQQKKLVSLTTAMPDQNPITVTETGKQLLTEADDRAKQEFDHLDLEILVQVSKGKTTPEDLGKAVNVRPKDLAMHLYRLTKQDFATYELASKNVTMMLTEKGFSQSKAGMPVKPQPTQPQPQTVQQAPDPSKPTSVPQPPEMMKMQQPPISIQQQPTVGGPTPTSAQQATGPSQSGTPPNAGGTPPTTGKEHKGMPLNKNLIIGIIVVVVIVVLGYLFYAKII